MDAKQVTGLMEAYNSIYAPQELNEVELWVNSLLEEGYDLSEYTWDEMYDTYLVTEFNTIVDGLLEEGYDLSQYTEQELFNEFLLKLAAPVVSNPKNLKIIRNFIPNTIPKPKITPPKITPPAPTPKITPPAPAPAPATPKPAPPKPATPAPAPATPAPKPATPKPATPAPKPATPAPAPKPATPAPAPKPATPAPAPAPANLNAPGGNNKGMLGLGAIGLAGLTSTLMGRGGGGNVISKDSAKTILPVPPVDAGSKRRKEQLVGQKGDLKATDPVMADAKNLNKAGGVSLGRGGTGYLAKQGDKLIAVQAKPIGADDGIIGQVARRLNLTKKIDRELEAQRQELSRKNRERYLQGQELTDKNVTGYQAKGAIRKGEKTGLNIKSSYEYDRFDTILEYLGTEGYDAYDLVLEYLLSQGHTDTIEEAHYVMMEMDEEIIGNIIEQYIIE